MPAGDADAPGAPKASPMTAAIAAREYFNFMSHLLPYECMLPQVARCTDETRRLARLSPIPRIEDLPKHDAGSPLFGARHCCRARLSLSCRKRPSRGRNA